MLESGQLGFPFEQDILHMRNDHLRMVLDLGWYPDGDPQGSYGLVLIQADPPDQHAEMPPHTVSKKRGGITYTYALQADFSGDPWRHPLVEFNSRDATEIAAKIDELLAKADSGELGTA